MVIQKEDTRAILSIWKKVQKGMKTRNVRGNDFSRFNFNLLRLLYLKCLNMSNCEGLVQLLELPSSIYVLKADYCTTLETITDISNVNGYGKSHFGGEQHRSTSW